MTEPAAEPFESWGLLELMGRQRIAGRITEQSIGGVHFLRVDVPAIGDIAAHTRMYTQSAIYGMTPLSEDVARALATRMRSTPVEAYELPAGSRIGYDSASESNDF